MSENQTVAVLTQWNLVQIYLLRGHTKPPNTRGLDLEFKIALVLVERGVGETGSSSTDPPPAFHDDHIRPWEKRPSKLSCPHSYNTRTGWSFWRRTSRAQSAAVCSRTRAFCPALTASARSVWRVSWTVTGALHGDHRSNVRPVERRPSTTASRACKSIIPYAASWRSTTGFE